MKLKIVQDCLVEGKHASAGDSLTVENDQVARELISIGRAKDASVKDQEMNADEPHIVPKDPAVSGGEVETQSLPMQHVTKAQAASKAKHK